MKKSSILLLFIVLAMGLSTCKRYPDGPWFSLRTKMARITGTDFRNTKPMKHWGIEKYLVNGVDSTAALKSRMSCEFPMSFERPKGGNVYCFFNCTGFGFYGNWGFVEKKEKIRMGATGPSPYTACFPPMYMPVAGYDGTWDIQRLTMKEFWLKTNWNNVEYYVELKR